MTPQLSARQCGLTTGRFANDVPVLMGSKRGLGSALFDAPSAVKKEPLRYSAQHDRSGQSTKQRDISAHPLTCIRGSGLPRTAGTFR
jgi:hypothetical protein